MIIENETVWTWRQTKGNKLKIISNKTKGTIKVLDEKGKILLHRNNLTNEQIKIIEEHFLSVVTNKIKNIGKSLLHTDNYDPMIA